MAEMVRFRTGYFDGALIDLGRVLDIAERKLAGIEFDTLVGTGFSGAIVVPALAQKLAVNFLLVRKENDDCHHGGGKLLGTLGEQWIFVDDLIHTGLTHRRVLAKVADGMTYRPHHYSRYLGIYLYSAWDSVDPYEIGWFRPDSLTSTGESKLHAGKVYASKGFTA